MGELNDVVVLFMNTQLGSFTNNVSSIVYSFDRVKYLIMTRFRDDYCYNLQIFIFI